jgi:hypothetical protein
MIHKKEVAFQLAALGIQFRFFGRPEIRELANVLNPGEQIHHIVNGFYQGGMALLVSTNRRLLLVDKKPLFLNLEDIRYEMISELDYVARFLDSTINLSMSNKQLSFRSYNGARLRELCAFVQDQITHFRQTLFLQDQPAYETAHARLVGYMKTDQLQHYTAQQLQSRDFARILPRKRPSKYIAVQPYSHAVK